MAVPRNLLNLKSVSKGYGSRTVLHDVTLGVAAGERIGIVGRNGDGKSTLLRLIAGVEPPDAGNVTRARPAARAAAPGRRARPLPHDPRRPRRPPRRSRVGRRQHVSRGARRLARRRRPHALSRRHGHRDRVALRWRAAADRDRAAAARRARAAAARRADEPPRRGGRRLARAPPRGAPRRAARRHPRPLVSRCRLDGDMGGRRRDRAPVRRRLRGLRPRPRRARPAGRGARRPPPPAAAQGARLAAARAAGADEQAEVPHRRRQRADRRRAGAARQGRAAALRDRAAGRQGARGGRRGAALRRRPAAAARPDLAPGPRRPRRAGGRQRLGQDDAAVAAGGHALDPGAGEVQRGATVRLARLSQDTAEIPSHLRVLESLEEVKDVATLSDGRQITASMLCDRFGFRGDLARTLVRDLSGGQRRRLQLMRLLMAEPNVLLLDEPTNDLDIETLTALEDLLDRWPGTLVVVSHDRYFVERVCDDVYALTGDGAIRHMPGAIEQYVQSRREAAAPAPPAVAPATAVAASAPSAPAPVSGGGAARAARKEIQRLERTLDRLGARAAELHEAMAASATDHGRLRELQSELAACIAQREAVEATWLEVAETLEA